ncbi:MAG: hypothetical protein GVY16_07375 [Planctomycetes bacterium]|jgi:type II secretory pathway component PulK|nr:general secretion pathway protein GspK [Phycisphaerae bacterium]NBB95546.1 hypothetical protein [Planctomycetota bacterium]
MSRARRDANGRRGTVLAITLMIVALMTMTAAAMLFRTTAEVTGAAAGRRGEQARLAAMSGIRQAISILDAPADTPVDIVDNPDLFQNQRVADHGTAAWYFTVFAPAAEATDAVRYGLIDEAGKININTADEETLANLGLDAERVACLLDWRDRDHEPRSDGAEQAYYASLQPIPYRTKNGPVITLEELLLVKGFDASVIVGEDANVNGLLDANEDDGNESFPPDDADGQLDRGLAAVATPISYERNMSVDGRPRININGEESELRKLASETSLPEQTVEFIRTVRKAGERFAHPAQLLEMRATVPADAVGGDERSRRRGRGSRRGPENVTVTSGVGTRELPEVLDRLTTRSGGSKTKVPGLVNVNTASANVLAALPEISDNTARQIVDLRDSIADEQKQTPAWLYAEGLLDADRFRQVAPRLTARSFQYRVRSVGFAWPGGQFRVVEAVIDLAGERPRIMYLRDLTRRGLPTAIDVDELTGAVMP